MYDFILFEVAPSELEDLIRRHSGVLDVAVVGVPDERVGQAVQNTLQNNLVFYAELCIVQYSVQCTLDTKLKNLKNLRNFLA